MAGLPALPDLLLSAQETPPGAVGRLACDRAGRYRRSGADVSMPEIEHADPASTEGRRRLPAASRRRQLLAVALDRFAAAGYHATSMEGIAEAAGVTKPVLYQHFSSKAELFRELIASVGEDLLQAVSTAASAEEDPYRRVLAGFEAYFRFVGHEPAAFTLLFDSGARQAPQFAEAVRSVEHRIAWTIGDLIEVDIEPAHRSLLAFGIVGLAETTSRRWLESCRAPGEANRGARATEGEPMAHWLADLVWAGLRALPARAPTP